MPPTAPLADRLHQAAARRVAARLWRQPPQVDYLDATHALVDGRKLTVFCHNDYLGLAHAPELVAARIQAASRWGGGSTASAMVCGYSSAHARLEEALAEWTGRSRALLFATGYMANVGVLQTLLGPGDLCVQDKLNHASLLDGARLAQAELRRYPHADAAAAARQLDSRPQAPALLASDGVFSMDGDIAPLTELAAISGARQALLLVDDAHGLGVLGPEGAGSVAAAGLGQDQVPLLIGTLGKAIGTAGAFVAGPDTLIEDLAQFARSHVYSTAPPPAVAEATLAAVALARSDGARRERLAELIRYFRRSASQLGLPLMPSQTPIQPLLLGDAGRAAVASQSLAEAGLLVTAIRPPTVPKQQARLRITLSAAHTMTQIDQLLDALDRLLRSGTLETVGSTSTGHSATMP
ncbi:8-amino-7-oxononanoate synthase [Frateuria aurantia]